MLSKTQIIHIRNPQESFIQEYHCKLEVFERFGYNEILISSDSLSKVDHR